MDTSPCKAAHISEWNEHITKMKTLNYENECTNDILNCIQSHSHWEECVQRNRDDVCSIAEYTHFHADETECCAFNPFSIFVGRSMRAGVLAKYRDALWHFVPNDTNFIWQSLRTPHGRCWLIHCTKLLRNRNRFFIPSVNQLKCSNWIRIALFACLSKLMAIERCISHVWQSQ